jgi:hypothetical protein
MQTSTASLKALEMPAHLLLGKWAQNRFDASAGYLKLRNPQVLPFPRTVTLQVHKLGWNCTDKTVARSGQPDPWRLIRHSPKKNKAFNRLTTACGQQSYCFSRPSDYF